MDVVEQWVRWAGGAAALATLAVILWGLWRAQQRPMGRATGQARRVLRWPVYLLASVGYFGLCYALWRPLPVTLSPSARAAALILGTLLYFPGLGLALWGRLALGEMYNVSSGFGAELYAGHRLVTHGPYACVRHPMYLGILLAGVGGILLYRTWTLVFIAANFLGLVVRAHREEQALAAEFGGEWEAYRRRVPAWIPRCRAGSAGNNSRR